MTECSSDIISDQSCYSNTPKPEYDVMYFDAIEVLHENESIFRQPRLIVEWKCIDEEKNIQQIIETIYVEELAAVYRHLLADAWPDISMPVNND